MKRLLALTVLVIGVGADGAGADIHSLAHYPARARASSVSPGTPTQTITVVNDAGVTGLAKVERAIEVQSLQLRRWWGTPAVVFGTGGWPITIVDYALGHGVVGLHDVQQISAPCPVDRACGAIDGANPYAIVTVWGWQPPVTAPYWSITFSHEIMEMLVDPQVNRQVSISHGEPLGLMEVCDPVEENAYSLDAVEVSDFVTPAYFIADSRGPWDRERMLTQGQ